MATIEHSAFIGFFRRHVTVKEVLEEGEVNLERVEPRGWVKGV
jgi:hypothetical protein